MRILIWTELSATSRIKALARPALAGADDVARRVSEIIGEVRRDGDDAIRRLTQAIDGVSLQALAVDAAEWDAAADALTAIQRKAIETAAANIERFHQAQIPAPIDMETMPGVRCQRVYRPISSVGLYVPAGSAPLPSTALMLGVPARIAGSRVRVMCSPPRADGTTDPAVLFAARIAGVDCVYKAGGAQAIAAMAYGTQTVPKVDKIFGPGNTWVTEAKEQIAGDPGGAARDYPAGPSEVLVVADGTANPEFVAADLLSQAEHGPDSQALLLSTDRAFAAMVGEAVARMATNLSRQAILQQSLRNTAAIVVEDVATAIALANQYAPEHLILQVAEPRQWLDRIDAAGSVFLGPWSPETIGDYCSGTNHVLPTYGFARSQSSLGVGDFLRSMTVQELTEAGMQTLGPVAETLADLEGLDAHGLAARVRLDRIAEGRQP